MSRPRIKFFFSFEIAPNLKGLNIGDKFDMGHDYPDSPQLTYTILKIHPRRGGVTTRKVTIAEISHREATQALKDLIESVP